MGSTPSCAVQEHCGPGMHCTGDLAQMGDSSVFDVYEIGNILGSGAFGQVRACWPISSGDDLTYAVKIIDVRETPAYISSMEEAEILQPLSHPHIVNLHDIYEHDHLLFLVQERITGGELFAAFADKENTINENTVAYVGQQLLEALQYMHQRHIVHRDIKAENVLLHSRPSVSQEWHVKLIDFGLAMRMESEKMFFASCREPPMLAQDVVCGTLYYCAPEVFSNYYGPKVDVWALGVMLYLALFGLYPYYDRDLDKMEAMICDLDVEPEWEPALAHANPGYQISESGQEALCGLLEKDPSDRPSAREALKDVWYQDLHSCDTDVYVDIPMAVRLKAYRSAQRPPVSPAKERDRTATIVALKQKMRTEAESHSARPVQPKEGLPFAFMERDDAVEVVDLDSVTKKFKHVEAMTVASQRTPRIQVA